MAVVAITAGKIQVVNGCKEGTAGEDVQEISHWSEAEERWKLTGGANSYKGR